MSDTQPPAKKSLGQHWLNDPDSLQAMCDSAELSASDTVLEIGPGNGTLTSYLLAVAQQVVAVELDDHLAAQLPIKLQSPKLSVIHEDILRLDLSELPAGYKVVANIPYYLTSHLIRVLSETTNPPAVVALLVQKEVAERVSAPAGQMSLLSVTAQWYWQVTTGRVVAAELFSPVPKIDSQILLLRHRQQPLFPEVEPKAFFRLVKAGFANRRKTLLNSLAAGLHVSKEQARELLEQANVPFTSRPQELSLESWHSLYTATLKQTEK